MTDAIADQLDGRPGRGGGIWEPPGLVLPKVGDRVQILSRPECYYCREEGESEAGLVGTVYEIEIPRDPEDWTLEALAHPYHVEIEEPERRIVFYLAACELTPLDAEHAPAGDEGE